MCYAYIIDNINSVIDRYKISFVDENLKAYPKHPQIIRPTAYAPTIILNKGNNKSLVAMKFGLIPNWSKDSKMGVGMCNARIETINTKPAYKYPFEKLRCLIPINGFYEYKREKSKSYPYVFTNKENTIFSLAGIYDTWIDEKNNKINSFSIITHPANKDVVDIHDRMPLILPKEIEDRWISDSIFNDKDLSDLIKYNISLDLTAKSH